jgi:hypothetical protein
VSCKAISIPALDRTIPVKPPIVKKKRKPRANKVSVLKYIIPPQIVANQEKIFIPVGTAIIIVADIK